MDSTTKVQLFGIEIDRLTLQQAVIQIGVWLQDANKGNKYVVTPNVDHIVSLNKNALFKAAYDGAALIVADGNPVVWASKLLGKPLPGTVPGSDLVPALFDYYQHDINQNLTVFLLGAMPGVAEKARDNIHRLWPNIKVLGLHSPIFGFDQSETESLYIAQLVARANADLVILGLGSPKQEVWANRYCTKLNAKVILCVGATIDFIAGEVQRAPVWVRQLKMEWAYRIFCEPKRLFKRYLTGAIVFPQLVFKAWKQNKN